MTREEEETVKGIKEIICDLCAGQPPRGAEGEPSANESPSRPSPGNPTVFSATINGGNPGEVTGETRGSRPGVPLNKLIGNGTSGSVGRAGGPGVRVGRFAGGILAAGFSQGVRGSFVRKRGGSRGSVCGGEGGVGQGDVIGGKGIRVGKMVTYNVGGT